MGKKNLLYRLNDAQRKMAAQNLNLARREAWRIQRTTGIDYQTLEGVAFLGLCKACFRFDETTGYKFSSLATPTIRGELLHYVRDKTYSVRLTHKMREQWCKGRKMLYKGDADVDIAKELGLELSEWQEIRSACSGPPLELNDQATPTEPLEPDEIDSIEEYLSRTESILRELPLADLSKLKKYMLNGYGSPPVESFKKIRKLNAR